MYPEVAVNVHDRVEKRQVMCPIIERRKKKDGERRKKNGETECVKRCCICTCTAKIQRESEPPRDGSLAD
jgi:hypothetical protein